MATEALSNFAYAHRPPDDVLLAALLAYREAPDDALTRAALLIQIYAAAQFAIHGIASRQPLLSPFVDEMQEKIWRGLMREERGKQMNAVTEGDAASDSDVCDDGDSAVHAFGQLLEDYDATQLKRSVYAWIWQRCKWVANDVRVSRHVALGEIEGDDADSGASVRLTLSELKTSDTPLITSAIRVHKLIPWLESIAGEMVGQTLEVKAKKGGAPQRVTFDRSHQDIWLAWLGLEVPQSRKTDDSDGDRYEVSEAALAKELGISKKRVQDRTDESYAYMLQHEKFLKYAWLMIPNRLSGAGGNEDQLYKALLVSLNSPKGKVNFRTLVHAWRAAHYGE